jgi:hypothetical protein
MIVMIISVTRQTPDGWTTRPLTIANDALESNILIMHIFAMDPHAAIFL